VATPTVSVMPGVDGKARSKEEKRLVLDNDQGELFGKEAFAIVAPVECAKDGKNSQVALCTATALKVGEDFGFPTWEINGKFYPGGQPLDRLAEIVK
jgi:hypothetical protein